MGQCCTPSILLTDKGIHNRSQHFKGTDSRDWGGLEMIEIDKTYFFTLARACLFLNYSRPRFRSENDIVTSRHFITTVLC